MSDTKSAYVLAAGIVEQGSSGGTVHAFVAVQVGPHSRLFQVSGPIAAPHIDELPPATTVDLGRFRREIELALAPALAAIREQGGPPAISLPSSEWICRLVIDHAAAQPL